MIYQIFIWHRFQPIICLTRDLMALDAMLLRPNIPSGIFFGQFSATPKRRTNECPAWDCAGCWTEGLKSGLSSQNPDIWPPYLQPMIHSWLLNIQIFCTHLYICELCFAFVKRILWKYICIMCTWMGFCEKKNVVHCELFLMHVNWATRVHHVFCVNY